MFDEWPNNIVMLLGTRGDVGGEMGNDNVEGWEMTIWWQQMARDDMNDNITMGTTIVATWDDKALDIKPRDNIDGKGIRVERKKIQVMVDVRKDAKGNGKHIEGHVKKHI